MAAAEGPGEGASPGDDALLTPGEVAAIFGVNPKTVTRWERAGRLRAIRTLGGHRRFRAGEVRRLRESGRVSDSE
ncbi:MAG: BldC family transcriptional regulator [Actinomycetota bacterium]